MISAILISIALASVVLAAIVGLISTSIMTQHQDHGVTLRRLARRRWLAPAQPRPAAGQLRRAWPTA